MSPVEQPTQRPYDPRNRHDVWAVYQTADALFSIVNVMGNPERYLHEDFYYVWKLIGGSYTRQRIEELMQSHGDAAFKNAIRDRLEELRRRSWQEYYQSHLP